MNTLNTEPTKPLNFFVVYHGDRYVGCVKAYDIEQARREAAYVYRHWCGNYVTALTVLTVRPNGH